MNVDNVFESMSEMSHLVEKTPLNIMFCDRGLNIRYMNQQSLDTLKKIENYLPIKVDKIIGTNIDVFHKNPAHQRQLLSNEKNLPTRALIQVGPEKLDLLVQAVHNSKGEYSGAMVTWSLVTEKLRVENEMARIHSMMENAPVNLMCADIQGTITYLNPMSIKTLKSLQKFLPIEVEKIKGISFDIFHKNPSHQRELISKESNLPYQAVISIGPEKLDLYVSAMRDAQGKYIGPMVVWDVVTKKENLLETLTSKLGGAAKDLSKTAQGLSENSKQTAQNSKHASKNAEDLSQGMRTVAASTEEMVASIREISRSSSEAARITKNAQEQADIANTTVSELGNASGEIGNVIKVISSIAQQTNLLALNATIEAARAGDAGKGFSVVASEVKELAKQTAKATEDISQRIKLVQDSSNGAVQVIAEISKVIESLNSISSNIASAVEEQTAVSNEVARVIQTSDRAVAAIVDTIKEVTKAAEQNLKGASDTLSASDDMQKLVDNVKDLAKEI